MVKRKGVGESRSIEKTFGGAWERLRGQREKIWKGRQTKGTELNSLKNPAGCGPEGVNQEPSENHESSILKKMVIKGKDRINIKALH